MPEHDGEWDDDPECECEGCGESFAADELMTCGTCEAYVCLGCCNNDGDDCVPDTCVLCGPESDWADEEKRLQREMEA